MRVSRIIVHGYQQFEALDLDLTNQETGKPLDRVCFLGSNGTGKTTLLRLVGGLLSHRGLPRPAGAAITLRDGAEELTSPGALGWFGRLDEGQLTSLLSEAARPRPVSGFGVIPPEAARGLPRRPTPMRAGTDLVVSVPADTSALLLHDPPKATLNEALPLRAHRPLEHEVGPHTADAFWRLLIAVIAKREEAFRTFLARDDNRKRTVEAVESDFADRNPEILPALAELWTRLLAPAGLEVDLDNIRLPSQLTDSLAVHIRLARSKQTLPYNALSSGMRSFLFRLGYLKTLFFEPPTGNSFVLVDEPEASLHPDFLYDLVEVYGSVCAGSQLFFATHSPIVAAQFKPEERVILEFDERRFVKASRGTAPEGDDPNDILRSEFHVQSILGKEGVRQWERFLELDELLRRETDSETRDRHRREYMDIGARYHFDPRPGA